MLIQASLRYKSQDWNTSGAVSYTHLDVYKRQTYGPDPENEQQLKATEAEFKELIEKILAAGRSDESLNSTGQLTAMQRIRALVDEGCWYPLNSLYNPAAVSYTHLDVYKRQLRRKLDAAWCIPFQWNSLYIFSIPIPVGNGKGN